MSKFFSLNFIFDIYPQVIHPPTFYIIVALFILFFLIGLVFAFLISKKRKLDKINQKLYSKISNWGLWSGVIGLFISFLRYQRAPYIGMRFWTIAWLLFNFIWFLFILKFYLKDIPKLKKELKEKQEFEKYLP